MSLIKKAHNLLLQARTETNPKRAMLLRKASATTYNQMIAFSFIYGVVTEDADHTNTTQAMNVGATFTDGVAKLIAKHHGLSSPRTMSSAQRLAREFFNAEELGSQRFYEKMIKDFTMSLKSQDKAEDAVHNILAGLNPVTESEFERVEARNQFAYAGKEHKNLPILLKNTAKQMKLTGDVIVENKYKDCIGAILSTISIINSRLKYNTRSSQPSTSLEGLVEDQNVGLIPSDSSSTDELVLSNLSQANIENLINLFQKGYGWKIKKSESQRRALAHYFFCMMVHFEKSELEQLVSNEEEEQLLELLAYSPKEILDDGRVERDEKMIHSFSKLIEMVSTYETDFLDELTYIYNDVNPFDPISKTTGQKAFGTGWKTFLQEIGQDLKASETGNPLLIPSAESAIENTSHIFKQGSQKKASLKSRVASLLRRYNQI